MTGIADNDSLCSFLWGTLDADTTGEFTARVAVDPALCRVLQEESAFEALFYSLSWETDANPVLDREFGAEVVRTPPGEAEFSNSAGLFALAEWEVMVDKAFRAASDKNISRHQPRARIFRFPALVRYLAAACFIAAVGLGVLLARFHMGQDKPTGMIVVSHRDFGTPGTPGPATVKTAVKVQPIIFDSVVIYQKGDCNGRQLQTENNNGIVRLGRKTAVLLDKNTSVAVMAQNDSAIAVTLNKGSAVFTVEKARYHSFSVTTPSSDIAVTGTVFRLAIVGDTTIVSVLEGSVVARHRDDTAAVTVLAGTSARIGPNAVKVEEGDTAATLLYRFNLLHDFIKENGVWENGRFVRSGMGGD